MKTFGQIYKLRNLMKEPACFKNPENSACIDLILTKKRLSFKNTYVIEIGPSGFHKMIAALMKMHFPKMKPQVVSYRKYKDFRNETFLDSSRHELNVQVQFLNEKGLNRCIFNYREIMTRRRLRNRFLRNRSEENRKLFCKPRNKCVSLLRKSKKDYFANLNKKNITDNKRFRKIVKPYL